MGASEQGADATAGRWLMIPRSLCFVRYESDVLLMKRGPHRRVFPNQYNGVGGHIERNEDALSAAQREIREETGLDVQNLQLCGIHNIDAGEDNGILMFVFTADASHRDFVDSSDEGTLHWIPVAEVGRLDLVEDLPHILTRVLTMTPDDAPYFAHVSYDEHDQIVINFATD